MDTNYLCSEKTQHQPQKLHAPLPLSLLPSGTATWLGVELPTGLWLVMGTQSSALGASLCPGHPGAALPAPRSGAAATSRLVPARWSDKPSLEPPAGQPRCPQCPQSRLLCAPVAPAAASPAPTSPSLCPGDSPGSPRCAGLTPPGWCSKRCRGDALQSGSGFFLVLWAPPLCYIEPKEWLVSSSLGEHSRAHFHTKSPAALLSPWDQDCLCSVVGMWVSYSPPWARGNLDRCGLCSPCWQGAPGGLKQLGCSLWNRAESHCIITTVWLKVPFVPLISKGSVPRLLCPHKPGKKNIDKGCDHRKDSAEIDGNTVAGRPCPVQIDKCQVPPGFAAAWGHPVCRSQGRG